MTKKIYVASLPYAVLDSELEKIFNAFGTVVSAKVIVDKTTGQGKGFGFVEMGTKEEAAKAIAELNGSSYSGRTILVSEAKTQA